MHVFWEILAGLLPSIGIGYLFYRIMRTLLEGDRKERAAYARWQAEHDAAQTASEESRIDAADADKSPRSSEHLDARGATTHD